MKLLVGGLTAALALAVSVGILGANPPSASAQDCGPMDVVFLIDDTGSMGGAIANVQAEAASLISDIDTASGGDYQLGLLTFKDSVVVVDDLNGAATVEADILALSASGGAGLPESSDEALNTAVNGLDAADRPGGEQTGDFDGTWRPAAVKIAILITDALPGGFDDAYSVGVDDVNAHSRALEADAADILISAVFVPTSGDAGQAAIMQDYATTTGGLYIETAVDGTGTADAIAAIIDDCGGNRVGGIVRQVAVDSGSPASAAPGSGSSVGVVLPMAGTAAAVLLATAAAGGWHLRRRWLR